jgi:KaiC/GvpD/RAD55 family RecA-like ATPase
MLNLRFGIPSLDAILVGGTEREAKEKNDQKVGWGGILLSDKSEGTSLCLIGPDGTGKSVFSMHLASQYLWDCKQVEPGTVPKIIYVSTDLRHEMALRMFNSFHLDRPVWDRRSRNRERIKLTHLPTAEMTHLAKYLLSNATDEIGFVDLASDSAGDDWALVTRIMSLLEEQGQQQGARHLLVVDAVEGLETLAGETDAYGQKVSRRARIALLMRLASHKCHLALVVEQTQEGTRLPEEFVADIVVRLRSTLTNGYTRRTLEVEKARGQAHHARGQHPFQIRSGKQLVEASVYDNLDQDPAHVIVYPSLHYQGNSIRKQRAKSQDALPKEGSSALVSFGIRHLDGLLKRNRAGQAGLPAGMPFAIIGDKGTFKSHLADAFLASCFADIAAEFTSSAIDPASWESCWASAQEGAGVAILATSKPRAQHDVEVAIIRQLLNSNPRAREVLRHRPEDVTTAFHDWMFLHLKKRVQLDTLVIQDQPGPRLFHRIDDLIHKAKEALNEIPAIARKNHRIRLILDDLSGFRDAYPELHEDPLLLPLIIQLTRLEGISTLLVATQSTVTDVTQLQPFDAALRAQVEGYLLTWRVSFFGEARTAVTFVAGSQADRHPTIREVRTRQLEKQPEILVTDVDPEFELYEGLESGRPQPVPLEIRLYLETSTFRHHMERENTLMAELFPAAVNVDGKANVITGQSDGGYDALRDYCYLGASSKLLKTLILQVDEFWRPSKRLAMLADLHEYISTRVDCRDASDPYEDQYSVFRLNGGQEVDNARRVDEYPKERTRRHFFPEFRLPGPSQESIDRVPFMWDFGFLLLSHNDWYSAAQVWVPILSNRLWSTISDKSRWVRRPWPIDQTPASPALGKDPSSQHFKFQDITIGTVLDALKKPTKHLAARSEQIVRGDRDMLNQLEVEHCLFRGPSSWRALLEAAAEVRRRRTARDSTVVRGFDVARPSAESFSGLVLEIWLSEVLEGLAWRIRRDAGSSDAKDARAAAEELLARLNSFESERQYSLCELLERFPDELYMTWMLLVEAVDFECLVDRDERFSFKEESDPTPAMAARHWYKTAAEASSSRYSEEPSLPVRLPGYFSTRGDWHLAMAAGSRSYRLGTRALDLLNSRRANITRLQDGLGLPVRDIVDPKAFNRFRTRLSYVNHRGRRSTVDYAALIGLGAESTRSYLCPDDESTPPDGVKDAGRAPFGGAADSSDSFFWIWRSRIRDYDRHSRVWGKWLVRLTLLLQGIKNEEAATWWNGFDLYDEMALSDALPPNISELRSYQRFRDMVTFLQCELGWTNINIK